MTATNPKRIYRGRKYRLNDHRPIGLARFAPNGPWHQLNLQELCCVTHRTQAELEADLLLQCVGDTIDGIEIKMPRMGLPITP